MVATIAVEAIFVVALVVGVRPVSRLWSNETNAFDRKPSGLGWSDEFWSGWVRAMPVGFLCGFLLVSEGVIIIIGRSGGADVAAVVLGAGLVASALTVVTVVLWNRPTAVVPPHLRNQEGLLRARRNR